jgi:Kae1-associated kinase Bud32
MKIIQKGAEAKIILSNNFIIKDRIPKAYRIPELDEKLRSRRTRAETKLLFKASEIIPCPKPFFKNDIKESKKIKMPYLNGKKISENLNKFSLKKQKEILRKIGKSIAKIHEKNIIHGDLTTSNMILLEEEVYLIDFGLGYFNGKIEDKAVDLHLFKKALEAKHFENWKILFEEFLKEYQKFPNSKIILERLKSVEKRGRYKEK